MENEENLFQISTLYQAHRDVVEELIWKNIYTMIFLSRFIMMNLSPYGLRRAISGDFIVGNYTDLIDVHKRPLSQMVHDISIDLGLIKE